MLSEKVFGIRDAIAPKGDPMAARVNCLLCPLCGVDAEEEKPIKGVRPRMQGYNQIVAAPRIQSVWAFLFKIPDGCLRLSVLL